MGSSETPGRSGEGEGKQEKQEKQEKPCVFTGKNRKNLKKSDSHRFRCFFMFFVETTDLDAETTNFDAKTANLDVEATELDVKTTDLDAETTDLDDKV